jgi:hypothetical protein
LIAFIRLSFGKEIICGIHLKVLMHAVRPEVKGERKGKEGDEEKLILG